MSNDKAFAKVIEDSVFRDTRLITLEIDLWRAILPELNTHRMISRNFQSTRAVPTKKLIEQVRENPYIPVKFAKNQAGMVAGEVFSGEDHEQALNAWLNAAKSAAEYAETLTSMGVHKEVAGRLIEPFMWTRGVVTATLDSWNAFLKLRLHKDAQPEIYALAEKVSEAISNSKPEYLIPGEWHLPYVGTKHLDLSLSDAIKVSVSCCGQVSYRQLDDSLEKAKRIYELLNLPVNGVYPNDPPHLSPSEHCAVASDNDGSLSGNFHSNDFVQYRKILEQGLESQFIN